MIRLFIYCLFTGSFILFVNSCEPEQSFDVPLILTGDVIDITDTSATFTGKITYTGSAPVSESGFLWGLNPAELNMVTTGVHASKGVFSLKNHITLIPGKTYYIRAFAKSGTKVIYGLPRKFTTTGTPEAGVWRTVFSNTPNGCLGDRIQYTAFKIDSLIYIKPAGTTDMLTLNLQTGAIEEFSLTNRASRDVIESFVVAGKAYLFAKNRFYRFDPVTRSFDPLAILPGILDLYQPSAFVIDNFIYFGLGKEGTFFKTKFWKYNIANDTWEIINTFPGGGRVNTINFSIDGIGYMGGGFKIEYIDGYGYKSEDFFDFWAYDPRTNEWIRKKDVMYSNGSESYNWNNSGYHALGKTLFEYNASFDLWIQMASHTDNCVFEKLISDDFLYEILVVSYYNELYLKVLRYEK